MYSVVETTYFSTDLNDHIFSFSFLDVALESNPSDHLKETPIFPSKCQSYAHDWKQNTTLKYVTPGQLPRMYSFCSTIFLDDSTLSQPNCANIIQCVIFALYYHIESR
ncbi:cyclin-Y-like protein 1 isoform X1 [Octodon degus]|uniref:Cyclin-Y-like protein 1 isoform X1 n=2 Tax=Octodon degus TaxID=10160 RepID=A0A6P6DU49_OCTDE|nr:cyclin-Y-like protein 1 isoform X1 [Octodon degus]